MTQKKASRTEKSVPIQVLSYQLTDGVLELQTDQGIHRLDWPSLESALDAELLRVPRGHLAKAIAAAKKVNTRTG